MEITTSANELLVCKQIVPHSLCNAMPSGDNMKSIDQSAATSARTDPYVSLSKQKNNFNDKFYQNPN